MLKLRNKFLPEIPISVIKAFKPHILSNNTDPIDVITQSNKSYLLISISYNSFYIQIKSEECTIFIKIHKEDLIV